MKKLTGILSTFLVAALVLVIGTTIAQHQFTKMEATEAETNVKKEMKQVSFSKDNVVKLEYNKKSANTLKPIEVRKSESGSKVQKIERNSAELTAKQQFKARVLNSDLSNGIKKALLENPASVREMMNAKYSKFSAAEKSKIEGLLK